MATECDRHVGYYALSYESTIDASTCTFWLMMRRIGRILLPKSLAIPDSSGMCSNKPFALSTFHQTFWERICHEFLTLRQSG